MRTDTRILVTGAGGFIGGWIVEALYLDGFKYVRAGIRRWSSAARIGRFPVEIVLCDIMNPKQIDDAMQGVDVVIHCAMGSSDVIRKGTENMLDGALKHHVKRFIHFSTVDVYGTVEGPIDEKHPLVHSGKAYGEAKIEAENLCWSFYKRGVPVVVLRPSIVYGPYAKLWIGKFAERLQSGRWGLFKGVGEGTCNLVYIRDLVNATYRALESNNAVGQAFNVNGADLITWNEYFSRLNDALGLPQLREIGQRKSTVRSVLMKPTKVAAHFVLDKFGGVITMMYQRYDFLRTIAKRIEKSMKTTPSGDELGMYGRKPSYRIEKARTLLGYEPAFRVDQGIEMSVRWLRHESLVSHNNGTESSHTLQMRVGSRRYE